MTSDRCPACNAAVTPGSPWCTLCYHDLRAPAAVPEPVLAASVPAVPAPVAAELPTAGLAPTELAPDPILDAPVMVAPPVARRELSAWPCPGCGTQVPIAENACTSCGRPFLPAEEAISLNLPIVGDVVRLDKGQRMLLMVAGMVVVTALFVVLSFMFGSVL